MDVERLLPDATLASLTGLRTKRIDFVCGVVRNFYASQVDRGTTKVRIGVQGSGKRPNYRLETPKPYNVHGVDLSLHATLIYNGANHEIMTAFEADRVQEETWSTEAMSFAQTEALLGELRQLKTK